MTTTQAASVTRITPILHADDADASEAWYAQLGFEVEHTHQFEPGLPRFDTLRSGDFRIFLSEHAEAPRGGVVYLHVEDVDTVAAALGVQVEDTPWGMRELRVADPAGNELRIGSGI
jgi:catechol 2,3-dioxygenase-like lactoylglutathione lyase family enzyme